MRAVFCNGCTQGFDNACIDVKEVITGHSWFSWHASRNNNNICSLQSLAKLVLTHIPSYLQKLPDQLKVTNSTLPCSSPYLPMAISQYNNLHKLIFQQKDKKNCANNIIFHDSVCKINISGAYWLTVKQTNGFRDSLTRAASQNHM